MIRVFLDDAAAPFESDIRELIKPFFPGESFEIHTPEGVHISERGREEKLDNRNNLKRQSQNNLKGQGLGGIKAGSQLSEEKVDFQPFFVHLSIDERDVDSCGVSLRLIGDAVPCIYVLAEELPLSGDRKDDKCIIKAELYRALSGYTGKELPWGALTGIRPVTLVSALLESDSPLYPVRDSSLFADDEDASSVRAFGAASNASSGAASDATSVNASDTSSVTASDASSGAASDTSSGTAKKSTAHYGLRHYMMEKYLLKEEKAELLIDIALREQSLLRSIETNTGVNYKDGWSLYIGIPFCPSRCLYCSFTSNPIEAWEGRLSEYLLQLKREISFCMEEMCSKRGKILQTVYIGGGTPTALPPNELSLLMNIVEEECFLNPLSKICEYTVEAGRPDSITKEKLSILRSAGVDRMSINPQSFVPETLKRIGRRHSPQDVVRAFFEAREAGFNNLNMDIIMGLPGEGLKEVTYTLCEVAKLAPESLTVHTLALKRAARLNTERKMWEGERLRPASDEEMDRMIKASAYAAELMSLKPYYLYRQKNMAGNLENVGYSLKGRECLYNILMMSSRHTIMGCGAGSASKAVFYDDADNVYNENGTSEINGEGRRGGIKWSDSLSEGKGVRTERCDNGKDIGNYLSNLEIMLERKREMLNRSL